MPSPTRSHILVIRFSSLGDVLLTLPILQEVLNANPQAQLFVLTKKSNARVFALLERTTVIEVDVETTHKSIFRLLAFFRHIIKTYHIDVVIDLHFVLRTMILRMYAFLLGVPFFRIDKQRKQKRLFLKEKTLHRLPSVWDVYRSPFQHANLPLRASDSFGFAEKIHLSSEAEKVLHAREGKRIAIAPFAHFDEKIYPAHLMEEVLRLLHQDPNIDQIFLLGKGEKEEAQMNAWCERFAKLTSLAHIDLLQQLKLLSLCQVALVMDSANLHVAGLAETKRIIAVFGATSERAGFSVWKHTKVLEKDIACHPCSIFGNKKCTQASLLCMEAISPLEIASEVLKGV